jgi:3-isopropylmalate dehydratase small subunit
MKLKGAAWRLGDHLKAGGQIISVGHDRLFAEGKADEVARHVLEGVVPDFARKVRPGDIIFAGKGFGWGHGHYHMQAVKALKIAGVSAAFADSFGGGFARKAINQFGFPAIEYPELIALVETGDEVEVDLSEGTFRNISQAREQRITPLPAAILEILELGGLEAQTLRRLGKSAESPT